MTIVLGRKRLERVAARAGGKYALWWAMHGRLDQQMPEGEWRTWLLLGGRGSGKTRSVVEATRDRVWRGLAKRISLVAPTAGDARDVLVEGDSGFLVRSPPDFRPVYEPSKRRLTWPNGARATLFSADEPDRLRGPQCDFLACDEIAAWKHPEAFDMALLGLRLGKDPRAVVATTPRPTKAIRDLFADPTTVTSHSTTYDNLENLAPQFRERIIRKYENTRLGAQELYGKILSGVAGALWTAELLEELRIGRDPAGSLQELYDALVNPILDKNGEAMDLARVPAIERIVVGVDPATTSGEDSDATGIVVCGRGADKHGYVLDDRTAVDADGEDLSTSPDTWGAAVIDAYLDWHADAIVVETNQGGDMCKFVLKSVCQARGIATPRILKRHAKVNKTLRAEPIAALYEQRRMHHAGYFEQLEDEQCTYKPGDNESPDHLDAMVHAMTELMLGESAPLVSGVGVGSKRPFPQ